MQEDQGQLARLLAPYLDSDGRPLLPLNEDLLLLKRGIDLRLLEFEEDCKRIQVSKQNPKP